MSDVNIITVADRVAEMLKENGIARVFLYPGGTIVPMINGCLKAGIRCECFKNEQGAAYAALAIAKLTGYPQVVMVTSGPGVTNVITPVADAFYDSIPLIIIAGQISTGELKSRIGVRQRGFQETPTVLLMRPISKHSFSIISVDNVLPTVYDAIKLSASGRMGPVIIDFPMDIQRSELTTSIKNTISEATSKELSVKLDPSFLSRIVEEIAVAAKFAKRPMLLLGQGALNTGFYDAYRKIAFKMDSFVVTSLLGVGSFSTNDSKHLGFIGHTGHMAANLAVYESDFLLVLGSRLDVRQTGTLVDQFVPNGLIAWVDLDPDEIANPRVKVKWKVEVDIASFCTEFLRCFDDTKYANDSVWQKKIISLKQHDIEDQVSVQSAYLNPKEILRLLGRLTSANQFTVVTGVGCHQQWAARHLSFGPDSNRLLTSGGHGAMGFDLPAAIGAAMVTPEKPVLCVVGDGSLLMNIQELASLEERRLNVKILVLNNNRLGMVSQFQLITWGSDPTTGNITSPDFSKIAKAFGISAQRLVEREDMHKVLNNFWNEPGPALLDVCIDPNIDVTPMLLSGQNMNSMWKGRVT